MARLFISVQLPQEIKEEVAQVQKELEPIESLKGSMPASNDAHITLCFLGEVEPNNIEAIKKSLETIKFQALKAQLRKIEWFEKNGIPSVIFIGVECPALALLAESVHDVLLPWAREEERPFASHITLMRVRSINDDKNLFPQLRSIVVEPLEFIINFFSLMESELTAHGSCYKEIAKFNG